MTSKTLWLVSAVTVFSLLFGTAALAGQDALRAETARISVEDEVTVEPTDEEAPTQTPVPPDSEREHPVVAAIATFFSVPYNEIEDLHGSGLGMGVIATIYLVADAPDKTPEEVLAMRAEDEGWHSVLKDLKNELKGGKLGAIMSGRKQAQTPDSTPTPEKLRERQRERVWDQTRNGTPKNDAGQGSKRNNEGQGNGDDEGIEGGEGGNGSPGGDDDHGSQSSGSGGASAKGSGNENNSGGKDNGGGSDKNK